MPLAANLDVARAPALVRMERKAEAVLPHSFEDRRDVPCARRGSPAK